MSAPDFAREPWKHPAVWPAHMVVMTRSYICDVAAGVATCECGWALCAKVGRGAGYVALDDAINDHWIEVIEAAERVPA